MPPLPTRPTAFSPTARQIDSWFGGMGLGIGNDAPSIEELQASLSWRITEPIRAVRARERLRAARAGTFRLPPRDFGASTLRRSRTALKQRLAAVAPGILDGSALDSVDGMTVEALLGTLFETVHSDDDPGRLWLLFIAISGCFPDQSQMLALARDIHGTELRDALARTLHHCSVWTSHYRSQLRTIKLVTDRPLAFADHTARYGFNSGIQRVTRQVLSNWHARGHDFELAAVTTDGTSLRTLDDEERDRVLRWAGDDDNERDDDNELPDSTESELAVPWQTVVFVPEAPLGLGAPPLTALARFSPNRTVAIGYDTIPVSGGHFVHRILSATFVAYLSMMKYFDEITCISQATADEFLGYNAALSAQGLTGPRVTTELLPLEPIPADENTVVPDESALPLVLSVGSNEVRKNQLSIVYAAELLWREGLQFELVLLGGRGDQYFTDIPDAVAALRAKGRAISVRRDVDEQGLADAYRSARFSVFISLQEGYGLPVTESLAVGTPTLTTSYGSTAEIAADGGCVMVDPRDDDAIVDRMRELLTDDDLLARLKAEIAARTDSTWGDYAEELWRLVSQAKGK